MVCTRFNAPTHTHKMLLESIHHYTLHSFPDVNECELATLGCSNSAECVNVPGTYTCVCSAGYQLNGDGVSCQGIIKSPSY